MKKCPHLTPAGACDAIRLSTGEPWLTCRAWREINQGCKLELAKVMKERENEKN